MKARHDILKDSSPREQGKLRALFRRQIFIPIAALLVLIVVNLIADPSFFAVKLDQTAPATRVLTGNLITILDNASGSFRPFWPSA